MLDTDDLALWYALNRLMTNYWADVDHNGGSQAHEFSMPDAGSAAIPRRVTWSTIFRHSGRTRGAPRRLG